MKPLTRKQQAVLEFAKAQSVVNGRFPTVREISEHFGLKSPVGAMCHMQSLEKKGRIINRGRYYSVVWDECCPTCGRAK